MSLISNNQQVLIIVDLTYIEPILSSNDPYGKIGVDLIAYSMKIKNVESSKNTYITSTNGKQIPQDIMPKMDDLPNGIYLMFMDSGKIYTDIIQKIYNVFLQLKNSIYEIDPIPKNVKMENNYSNTSYSLYRFLKFPDTSQNIKDIVFLNGIKHLIELIIINLSNSLDIMIKPTGFTPPSPSIMYKFNNPYIGNS
jgi:hypothetical protein